MKVPQFFSHEPNSPSKNPTARAGGVTQMVECLSSKYEALSSNPVLEKKKKHTGHILYTKMLIITIPGASGSHCNSNYVEKGNWEDCSWRPALAKSYQAPFNQ
jgi:hypothetical protein